MKSKIENPTGLYRKYHIEKIKLKAKEDFFGNTFYEEIREPVDVNSEYFILRIDEGGSDINHIKACRIALHAYADAIEAHIPKLATDLREKYPLL